MQKLNHLAFIIIFTSCRSEPDFQNIMMNKTVKVFSQDYHNDAENYTFKWEPPVGPSKMAVPFDLKNDLTLFFFYEIQSHDLNSRRLFFLPYLPPILLKDCCLFHLLKVGTLTLLCKTLLLQFTHPCFMRVILALHFLSR